ncbi:MAG: hypothetical protein R3B06_14465 [Kofleriaceae bacterium]
MPLASQTFSSYSLSVAAIAALALAAACTEAPPLELPTDPGAGAVYAFVQRGWILDRAAAHSVDLDGDGHPDNQLGRLIDVLGSLGLAVNDAGAEQFASGELRIAHVVRADSLDDGTAAWTLRSGAGAPPRFDGTDQLTLPVADGGMVGRIVGGRFEARAGELTLRVPLFPGQPAMAIPVVDGVVQLALRGGCGGTLAGAIGPAALDALVDVMAAEAVAHLAAHPDHPFTATAIRFLDSDGDGRVSAAEVADLALGLLVPDVDLDGDGAADHVAVGLGFDCVPARAITAATR